MSCLLIIWISGYALTIIGMVLHERTAPALYHRTELLLLLLLPITWPFVLLRILWNAAHNRVTDFVE